MSPDYSRPRRIKLASRALSTAPMSSAFSPCSSLTAVSPGGNAGRGGVLFTYKRNFDVPPPASGSSEVQIQPRAKRVAESQPPQSHPPDGLLQSMLRQIRGANPPAGSPPPLRPARSSIADWFRPLARRPRETASSIERVQAQQIVPTIPLRGRSSAYRRCRNRQLSRRVDHPSLAAVVDLVSPDNGLDHGFA